MVAGTIDVSREEIERCKPKYESEEVRTANVIKNLRKETNLITSMMRGENYRRWVFL